MKVFSLLILLIFTPLTFAETKCFIAQENGKVLKLEGECNSRYSPCSTFKIAISLMGYNEGLLIDEMHPELAFKKGYVDYIDNWKQPHTPTMWMKNSCVWYSQVLTQKLGMNKFKEYVKKFNYGNQDLSGDKGEANGLTRSWLSSSLEISPYEQITFLQSLLDKKLQVSAKSYEMTRSVLFLGELPGGWKLYGKTGSGSLLSADRTKKLDIQHGWFVGWIERSGRTIIFANHIVDDKKYDTYAGPRAKLEAKEKFIKLL